jgi:hypothetical protein
MDIRTISGGLYSAKGWMKLVGVLLIVYGVLTALTIIGLVVAWLPVWMGILLFQSAKAVEICYEQSDPAFLTESLNKLKTYFTIMGVLTLIGLILGILSFVLGGLGALASLAGS